jgi:hypothetical protein
MSSRGSVLAVVACGVVVLTSCSPAATERAAVARAKCTLPTMEKLGLTGEDEAGVMPLSVEDLGGGDFRVTGEITVPNAGSDTTTTRSYVCEVTPDSADQLRGFRVTRLDLGPARVDAPSTNGEA